MPHSESTFHSPFNRHSNSRGNLLPTHTNSPQPQFRPRSTLLAHREDLGRQAVRQARRARMSRSAKTAGLDEDDADSSDMTSSEDLEMDPVLHPDADGVVRDGNDEEAGLTGADRDKKRRHKKGRRRRMDGGSGGGGETPGMSLSKQEEHYANRYVAKNLLINAMFIGLWYFFSISISLYNKWMFNDKKNQERDAPDDDSPDQTKPNKVIFPFPLFTTCAHMLVQFGLAACILWAFPKYRPSNGTLKGQRERLDQQSSGKKSVMTWWFYWTRIAPCGLATGTDIGLGNMSLRFITLTFYTMCKSSVLGFVLVFAFIFRLEKPTLPLVAVIAVMTAGVIMMVAGETKFDTLGFVLVMTAAASSGFRWSLTQILLLRNAATSNPFSSIFFLAPVMFLVLLIIAIPIEGPVQLVHGLVRLAEMKGTFLSAVLLIFPGCLAFAMTASEFALLQRSSVVTLSIAGIFKEVIMILTAVLVNHDDLTLVNVLGLLVTIACIAFYNYMKITKMRNEARIEAHLANADYQPVHTGEEDDEVVGGLAANGRTKSPERRGSAGGFVRPSLTLASSSRSSLNSDAKGESRVSPIKRPEDRD